MYKEIQVHLLSLDFVYTAFEAVIFKVIKLIQSTKHKTPSIKT